MKFAQRTARHAVKFHITCTRCGCRMEMTANGRFCWNCYINDNR